MRRLSVLFSLMAALVVTGCSSQSEEVNVYSARKEALIKPLLDRFTSETGITVNLITGSADALVERMKAEGEHSPADVLITTDAGRLYRAQQEGQLATTESDTLAEQVAVFWPNQDGRGAHINISGAGVATNAPNPDNARQLIEFLVNDESQQWYAETNYEYPVRADVPVSDLLQEWGEFKQDDLPLIKLGELNADAVKLMDRAGWK